MKRKGISEVVATVIMIGLVMAAAAIIWGVVKGMLDRQMVDTENCMGSHGKAKLYSGATCYNGAATSGEFYFYVETSDANLSKIIVSVYTSGGSKTIEIPSSSGYSDVREYDSKNYNTPLNHLGPNSGKRYVLNISSRPESISVVPVVGKTQCSVSDTITSIRNC